LHRCDFWSVRRFDQAQAAACAVSSEQEGLLPEDVCGGGRGAPGYFATFAADMEDGIVKGGGVEPDDPKLKKFMERVKYFTTNFDDDAGFEKLKAFLAEFDEKLGPRATGCFIWPLRRSILRTLRTVWASMR
jgi:glucose-6-phosphate 1-dehydrogenase